MSLSHVPNMGSLRFMFLDAKYLLSILRVLFVSFKTRGLPCFAVSGYIAPFCRSKFLNVILISSTGLSPVSLLIAIAVLNLSGLLAIINSIFVSCGILGILAFSWYFGFVHVRLNVFT